MNWHGDLVDTCADLATELERVRRVNAELLAALRGLVIGIGDDDPNWKGEASLLYAKELIARAEGRTP